MHRKGCPVLSAQDLSTKYLLNSPQTSMKRKCQQSRLDSLNLIPHQFLAELSDSLSRVRVRGQPTPHSSSNSPSPPLLRPSSQVGPSSTSYLLQKVAAGKTFRGGAVSGEAEPPKISNFGQTKRVRHLVNYLGPRILGWYLQARWWSERDSPPTSSSPCGPFSSTPSPRIG